MMSDHLFMREGEEERVRRGIGRWNACSRGEGRGEKMGKREGRRGVRWGGRRRCGSACGHAPLMPCSNGRAVDLRRMRCWDKGYAMSTRRVHVKTMFKGLIFTCERRLRRHACEW